MLNPNNDRLDYGQILAPPADHMLDFAVGTTYSLDLDALVGASLAMGLSEETDSELLNNPVCLLEALRSTGDKVALFSEGGQIHMPNQVTALYILLEKMVFSVKTEKHRGLAAYPSFHPKFWLLRYKSSTGELLYRVIVLSRNLTFDRSWDITYYMDGTVSRRRTNKNQPLCDFLQYLVGHLPSDENGKEKAKLIKSFIKELPYVSFEPEEKEFYDFEFIPTGVKKASGGYYQIAETSLFTETFHEMMIISPFLTGSVLRSFNDRNIGASRESPGNLLITREMSLGKLKPADISRFRIFTMRDTVVDGETAISDGPSEIQKQDIHAKVYMMRKYSDSDLYLGSLNASHNAAYGNVEFMLMLRSKNRYLNLDKLTDALFGREKDGSDNPFQEVTLQNAILDEEDSKRNDLDGIIKEINRSDPIATVLPQAEDYSVAVSFGDVDTKGYQVIVRPLLSKKTVDFENEVLFEGLQMTQLSEFYSITVSDEERSTERVLKIPTLGIPDDREKAVVSSVVTDRDCFYRYIAFLLGDDAILGALEGDMAGDAFGGIQHRQAYKIPALYEKMLETTVVNPDKLKGVEYLLKTLSADDVIPDEFEKLYATFKKVVKIDG